MTHIYLALKYVRTFRYGLPADIEALLHTPLCLFAGGSGGVPFAALVCALAHRYVAESSIV
jgi:hypothetical protein